MDINLSQGIAAVVQKNRQASNPHTG